MLIPKSGWKLIEEDGQYVRLARKAQHSEDKMIVWDIAAVLTGTRNGNPDVWIKPTKLRHFFTDEPAVRIIRDVPDEEAVAIILRAAKENPF